MLGNDYFFHDLLKKYIYVFGHVFNDVYLNRVSDDSTKTQKIKVPISYGDKDKVLANENRSDDTNLEKITRITLPRIVFNLENVIYDSGRNFDRTQKYTFYDADNTKMSTIYVQIPYILNFKTYIIGKSQEDMFKIVEQILPFFAPSFTFAVELIPSMNITLDCPIDLKSPVSFNNNYIGDIKEHQVMYWELNFQMKVFFFGPIRQSGLIRFANTNLYIPNVPDGELYKAVGNTSRIASVDVRPGLTANGTPTSNAELSIPISQIEPDDNYGYIITITDPIL